MKPLLPASAMIAALALSGCGSGVDGTYCIADAGKLVFKGGKVATDTGEAAGTYKADGDTVVFTDKVGTPRTFKRETDGSLSGDFALKRCK